MKYIIIVLSLILFSCDEQKSDNSHDEEFQHLVQLNKQNDSIAHYVKAKIDSMEKQDSINGLQQPIEKQFPNAPDDFECVYEIDGKCYDDRYENCDLLTENGVCLHQHNRIGYNNCCLETSGICYYCDGHLKEYTEPKKPKIKASTKPLADSIIVFTAKWCNLCTKQKNELKQANITFKEVDVDESPDIAKQYNVKGVPRLIFMKNGKKLYDLTGYTNIKDIKPLIEK